MIEKDTKKALEWIVGVLHKHQVPFQITGGCAAKIYGSPRDLNDIDIDIPDDGFEKIFADVQPYITFGPKQHKDVKWDVYLLTLNYAGQEIDITSQHFKVSNKNRDEWITFTVDFQKSVSKQFLGLIVPTIPASELLAYKKHLDGEQQQIDIAYVRAHLG